MENQSLNGHNTNKHKIYSASSSSSSTSSNSESVDYDYDPNQINIAEFRPAVLDFKEQPIGVPKVETVLIINTGKESLKLDSIFGSTIHFHCSFFLDKVTHFASPFFLSRLIQKT